MANINQMTRPKFWKKRNWLSSLESKPNSRNQNFLFNQDVRLNHKHVRIRWYHIQYISRLYSSPFPSLLARMNPLWQIPKSPLKWCCSKIACKFSLLFHFFIEMLRIKLICSSVYRFTSQQIMIFSPTMSSYIYYITTGRTPNPPPNVPVNYNCEECEIGVNVDVFAFALGSDFGLSADG